MDMLIIKKFYWSWIHLIEQTCPSWPVPVKKKPILNYLIISVNYCLYSRGGGDEGGRTPLLFTEPLTYLSIRWYYWWWDIKRLKL